MIAGIEFAFYTAETGQWVFEAGTHVRRYGNPQKWFKRFETPEKDESTKQITEPATWSKARYGFIHKMFAECSNSIVNLLLLRAEAGITEVWTTSSPPTATRLSLTLTMLTDGSCSIELSSGYCSTHHGSKNPKSAAKISVAMAADGVARMLDYYTMHPREES
jgi:hypothetical protein